MICPECGKEMEPEFIWTNGPYLFWADKTKLYFKNFDRLKEDSWAKGAHLPAFRCTGCKLMMAHYESYDEAAKKLISGSALTYERPPEQS